MSDKVRLHMGQLKVCTNCSDKKGLDTFKCIAIFNNPHVKVIHCPIDFKQAEPNWRDIKPENIVIVDKEEQL